MSNKNELKKKYNKAGSYKEINIQQCGSDVQQFDQQIQSYSEDFLKRMKQQQSAMIEKYVLRAKGLSVKQLMAEREDMLREFHHINNDLNQILANLNGNTNQLSFSKYNSRELANNYKQHSFPKSNYLTQLQRAKHRKNQHSTQINNEQIQSSNHSNINPKYPKTSIKSASSNIKTQFKDQLLNLNNNQIDSLSDNYLKLIISLEQEIQDYQFMLTPEYSEKLDHEIKNDTQHKKELQQQISSLTKIIHKNNKNYDQQVMVQLEKYSYDKQLELNRVTKKLNEKLEKFKSIESQSKQKLENINYLSQQQSQLSHLLQMYEDEDYQAPEQGTKKQEMYQKLQSKKKKIERMISTMNSNRLKEYNRKLSNFRLLQNQNQQYDQLIQQTDHDILILLNQKVNFHEHHKKIINKPKIISNLNKTKIISNLQHPFQFQKSSQQIIHQSKSNPIHHSIPSTKHHSFHIKQHPIQQPKQNSIEKENRFDSFLQNSNKLKSFSQHSNSKNDKIHQLQSTDNFILHNNSDPHQNTILPEPQNRLRRRIYTQLENSHYFTSLERNHYTQKASQSEELKKKNIDIKDKTQIPLTTEKQKQFNASVKGIEGKLDKKQKKYNDRNDKSVIEIQQRLQKLQYLLQKDEIALSALKRIEQQLQWENSNQKTQQGNSGTVDRNINRKNPSYDETYHQKQFQEFDRRELKKNVERSHQHYKELCERLGKNKLLIQEDTDIGGLIYQGMTRKSERI